MNYSDCSDFEINRRVAELLGKFEYVSDCNHNGGSAVLCYSLRACDEYDYCNNPSDAWSIIAENKIDIELPHEEVNQIGFASNHFEGVVHEIMPNDNPLRAACIVYLMMQEGKQCLASQ